VITATFPDSFSLARSENAMRGLYLAMRGKSRRDYNHAIDLRGRCCPTPFHSTFVAGSDREHAIAVISA